MEAKKYSFEQKDTEGNEGIWKCPFLFVMFVCFCEKFFPCGCAFRLASPIRERMMIGP